MPAQPKKYFIKTFGCQANKSDSERLAGDYSARGYCETVDWKQADEIVVNICSVRQRAEDRVQGFLQNIDEYFSEKTRRPKIILTGCMTHHGQKALYELLPQVDEISPSMRLASINKPLERIRSTPGFPSRLVATRSVPSASSLTLAVEKNPVLKKISWTKYKNSPTKATKKSLFWGKTSTHTGSKKPALVTASCS